MTIMTLYSRSQIIKYLTMKTYLFSLLLISLPFLLENAQAQTSNQTQTQNNVMNNNYPFGAQFTPQRPSDNLSPLEKKAMEIVRSWKSGKGKTSQPFYGGNGQIKFIFGAQEPSIICSILHVTDIAFEPGENINSIHLGDTARWNVIFSKAATPNITHLFIKPLDTDLSTNLIVVTDRRVYHMALKSTENQYMPSVAFEYAKNNFQNIPKVQTKSSTKRIVSARSNQSSTKKNSDREETKLAKLYFHYDIIGSAPWMPLRVYNDGEKTVIDMPNTLKNSDAPILFLLQKEGGIFSKDKTAMVNYRIVNNRYIVDDVFEKAILLSGLGSDQEKIIIVRK